MFRRRAVLLHTVLISGDQKLTVTRRGRVIARETLEEIPPKPRLHPTPRSTMTTNGPTVGGARNSLQVQPSEPPVKKQLSTIEDLCCSLWNGAFTKSTESVAQCDKLAESLLQSLTGKPLTVLSPDARRQPELESMVHLLFTIAHLEVSKRSIQQNKRCNAPNIGNLSCALVNMLVAHFDDFSSTISESTMMMLWYSAAKIACGLQDTSFLSAYLDQQVSTSVEEKTGSDLLSEQALQLWTYCLRHLVRMQHPPASWDLAEAIAPVTKQKLDGTGITIRASFSALWEPAFEVDFAGSDSQMLCAGLLGTMRSGTVGSEKKRKGFLNLIDNLRKEGVLSFSDATWIIAEHLRYALPVAATSSTTPQQPAVSLSPSAVTSIINHHLDVPIDQLAEMDPAVVLQIADALASIMTSFSRSGADSISAQNGIEGVRTCAHKIIGFLLELNRQDRLSDSQLVTDGRMALAGTIANCLRLGLLVDTGETEGLALRLFRWSIQHSIQNDRSLPKWVLDGTLGSQELHKLFHSNTGHLETCYSLITAGERGDSDSCRALRMEALVQVVYASEVNNLLDTCWLPTSKKQLHRQLQIRQAFAAENDQQQNTSDGNNGDGPQSGAADHTTSSDATSVASLDSVKSVQAVSMRIIKQMDKAPAAESLKGPFDAVRSLAAFLGRNKAILETMSLPSKVQLAVLGVLPLASIVNDLFTISGDDGEGRRLCLKNSVATDAFIRVLLVNFLFKDQHHKEALAVMLDSSTPFSSLVAPQGTPSTQPPVRPSLMGETQVFNSSGGLIMSWLSAIALSHQNTSAPSLEHVESELREILAILKYEMVGFGSIFKRLQEHHLDTAALILSTLLSRYHRQYQQENSAKSGFSFLPNNGTPAPELILAFNQNASSAAAYRWSREAQGPSKPTSTQELVGRSLDVLQRMLPMIPIHRRFTAAINMLHVVDHLSVMGVKVRNPEIIRDTLMLGITSEVSPRLVVPLLAACRLHPATYNVLTASLPQLRRVVRHVSLADIQLLLNVVCMPLPTRSHAEVLRIVREATARHRQLKPTDFITALFALSCNRLTGVVHFQQLCALLSVHLSFLSWAELVRLVDLHRHVPTHHEMLHKQLRKELMDRFQKSIKVPVDEGSLPLLEMDKSFGKVTLKSLAAAMAGYFVGDHLLWTTFMVAVVKKPYCMAPVVEGAAKKKSSGAGSGPAVSSDDLLGVSMRHVKGEVIEMLRAALVEVGLLGSPTVDAKKIENASVDSL